MSTSDDKPPPREWEVFWRGADTLMVGTSRGAQDVALRQFWSALFETELERRSPLRLLDVACGNGAVTRYALQMPRAGELTVVGLDYSHSAVRELTRTASGALGVACDARTLAFAPGSFDLVASQFGLEYAGEQAFVEAARVLGPGGAFAAIVHLHGGGIYQECLLNFDALQMLETCALMERTRAAFEAGFALLAGQGSQVDFDRAQRELEPAAKTVGELLRQRGQNIAGGFIARLFNDLGHMYPRMRSYAPEEVLAWLARMGGEIDAYRERMASMLAAAHDEAGLQRVREVLATHGLAVEQCEKLRMGPQQIPAAWTLVCRRRAT